MNTTFSLVPYQVSRPHTVPAGGIVTVAPAVGATATVEYTKGSHADILNNVAAWAPWAKGNVTASTSDLADQLLHVRVTALGGSVSVTINPNPSTAELGALSVADWGAPAQLATDASGNTAGIMDPKTGSVISLSGGGGGGPTVPQLKRLMAVSITFPEITVDQTSGFPPRLAVAERNRRRLVFKNPATNTVSFQFGYRQADNIQNPNYNFTPSYTIAPGQELVCLFDEAQWWGRQANTSAVAGQALTVEREVLV